MNRELFSDVFPTAAGWVGILGSTDGLQRVILPRRSAQEVQKLIGANAVPKPEFFADLQERLQAYFYGRKVNFPDRLDLSGATPFLRQVWEITRQIPYSQTRSYQWVARQIGRPGAARAVGQAMAKNHLPIIVPCHRVLASDSGLRGYNGGIKMKKLLLGLEGVISSPQ